MVDLLLINGLTKKRKSREVNRIPPAGFRKFQSVFSFAVFDKLAFSEPFT